MSLPTQGVFNAFKHPEQITEDKCTKKINATLTQIQSYKEFKASGKGETEKAFILMLIRSIDSPCSRRSLEEISKIPINHMTRVMRDLMDQGSIYIAKIDRCQYTGKRVQFYSPKILNDE